MIIHGTGRVQLFNLMSDHDFDLISKSKSGFEVANVPDWYKSMEEVVRGQMSLNASFNDVPPVPNPEDLYSFDFRHISATIVGGGSWKATDFSDEKVLKPSTNLLSFKPAYKNHYLAAGEEIGFLGEMSWKKSYTNAEGDTVPAGIEGPFVIDRVLYPDLVRKMNSPVSPIDSASVTVLFEWDASHEFEDERDFYWHIGEVIEDHMVRRVVTKVVQYEESSLVWAGADPYAKMLNDDSEVVDIDKASAFAKSKFSNNPELSERDWGKKYFVFDCLDESKLLHLGESVGNFNISDTMNEELLQLLAQQMGTTVEALKSGQFKKADAVKFKIVKLDDYQELEANAGKFEGEKSARETAEATLGKNKTIVDNYNKNLVTLQQATGKEEFDDVVAEVVELGKFKKENEAFATVGKEDFEATRKQAQDLYTAFCQGNPDESIDKELKESNDINKLRSYVKMFGGKLASQDFKATCSKCESGDHITYQSSATPTPGTPSGDATGRRSIGQRFRSGIASN